MLLIRSNLLLKCPLSLELVEDFVEKHAVSGHLGTVLIEHWAPKNRREIITSFLFLAKVEVVAQVVFDLGLFDTNFHVTFGSFVPSQRVSVRVGFRHRLSHATERGGRVGSTHRAHGR